MKIPINEEDYQKLWDMIWRDLLSQIQNSLYEEARNTIAMIRVIYESFEPE